MKYIILIALFGCAIAMRQQAVAVSGRLMCGNKPAAGVKVKLWDEDDGPDPDDVLDEGYTDSNGEFHLKGSERELTNIDPVFKVYHDCDDGIKPGQRKVKFRIPDSYISAGGVAKRVFDIGVLNLETIFPKEERDLLSLICNEFQHIRLEMSKLLVVNPFLVVTSIPLCLPKKQPSDMRNILLLLFLVGFSFAMRQQAVGVTGQLMCGNKPAAGVRVKLWDEDDGIDPDDLLDEGYTDSNGNFNLQGSERELTTIDPVFKVYHDCDDGLKVSWATKSEIPHT
ncbi:Transthyretin-like family protein [Ancylostoma caninum]|uniref:Transthyretin-like family protein n=1 Tax=Ancylostoma caninum TaxID=29170 RepID=A0A368FXG1_ANCCA|nr:Transthyretin-like family protein [Ancylostoma caninum]